MRVKKQSYLQDKWGNCSELKVGSKIVYILRKYWQFISWWGASMKVRWGVKSEGQIFSSIAFWLHLIKSEGLIEKKSNQFYVRCKNANNRKKYHKRWGWQILKVYIFDHHLRWYIKFLKVREKVGFYSLLMGMSDKIKKLRVNHPTLIRVRDINP